MGRTTQETGTLRVPAGGEERGAGRALAPPAFWAWAALAALATAAFGLLSVAGEAQAAALALQSFDPEGAAKGILKAFAFFIALVAIFVAVGRFARGAMMQGFGVILAGGVLFAIAFAPESLLSFGEWVLEQFGV